MGYTAVVDYGAGNLMSVTNALRFLGLESRVTADKSEIERADRIILPGVGAFPAAMQALNATGLSDFLKQEAAKKPFLGICLGMQMLFDKSFEISETEGLGIVPGRVEKIDTALKLPHIGWNSLKLETACPLLKGVDEGEYVYFVHSFCGLTLQSENLAASTDYGTKVAAVVFNGSVFGCQFHPEKSGDTGLRILKNFGAM